MAKRKVERVHDQHQRHNTDDFDVFPFRHSERHHLGCPLLAESPRIARQAMNEFHLRRTDAACRFVAAGYGVRGESRFYFCAMTAAGSPADLGDHCHSLPAAEPGARRRNGRPGGLVRFSQIVAYREPPGGI